MKLVSLFAIKGSFLFHLADFHVISYIPKVGKHFQFLQTMEILGSVTLSDWLPSMDADNKTPPQNNLHISVQQTDPT
jgi:hypothetical protein